MNPTQVVTSGLALLVLSAGVPTQVAADYHVDLHSDVLAQVAQFPDETRQAALVAAGHPSLLIRVARLQKQSSQRFERLLKAKSAAERADTYALIAVPGLVDLLVAAEGGDGEVENALASYPASITAPARRLLRHSPNLLRDVAGLNRSTEIAFHALLEDESAKVRQALQSLTAHPGAIAGLTDDLGGTVLLAQEWAQDPSAVLRQMDELREEPVSAPVFSGPYADVAADYQARYAYAPPAAAVDSEVRIVHTGYVAPYWYGVPYRMGYYGRGYYGGGYYGGGGYWGGSLGWHITPHVYASVSFPFGPRFYRSPRVVHRTHRTRTQMIRRTSHRTRRHRR
jgi:hypothetical protein